MLSPSAPALQFAGGLAFLLKKQGSAVAYGTGTLGDASGDCYNLTNMDRIAPEDCTRERIAVLRQHEMRADAARA